MVRDEEHITATRLQATFRELLAWFVLVAVLATFPLLAALIWNFVATNTFDLAIFRQGELLGPAYAISGAAIAQWFGKENVDGWTPPIKTLFILSNAVLMMFILVLIWGISLHALGSFNYGSNAAGVVTVLVGLSIKLTLLTAAWGGIGQVVYLVVPR